MSKESFVQRVSAKAVIESKGDILVLHPSSIDLNKNWHIPGGIRDDITELLETTVVREVREETGIDLTRLKGKVFKIGEWPAVDKGEKVMILAVFFHFTLPSRPQIVLSEEHDDFAWINDQNISDYETSKEVREIVEQVQRANIG